MLYQYKSTNTDTCGAVCQPVAYLKCGKWRVEPKHPATAGGSSAPPRVHVVTDAEAAAARASLPQHPSTSKRAQLPQQHPTYTFSLYIYTVCILIDTLYSIHSISCPRPPCTHTPLDTHTHPVGLGEWDGAISGTHSARCRDKSGTPLGHEWWRGCGGGECCCSIRMLTYADVC